METCIIICIGLGIVAGILFLFMIMKFFGATTTAIATPPMSVVSTPIYPFRIRTNPSYAKQCALIPYQDDASGLRPSQRGDDEPERNYTYYQYVKDSGDVIAFESDLQYRPDELLAACDTTPGCIAFQTDGSIIGRMHPRCQWKYRFPDVKEGTWILDGYPIPE